MTAIILPTALGPAEADPQFLSWGNTVTPPLGGPDQPISRIGSRYGVAVTLPPMPAAVGKKWTARLTRAQDSGQPARMKWPLMGDVQPGGDGIAIATSVAGGTSLAVSGGSAGALVAEGNWLSILRAGRMYLYQNAADVTLNGSGAGTLTLNTMLRTPVTAGTDTVNLTTPYIDGGVGGDSTKWTLARSRTVGLSFTLAEQE